jgi:uncharacterized membrane protein
MKKFSSTVAIFLGGGGIILSGHIAKLQANASGTFAQQLMAYQLLCIIGTFILGAGAWLSIRLYQDKDLATAITPFGLSLAVVGTAAMAILLFA